MAITGSVTAANKIYDGNDAATITSRTLTGVISGDTVSYAGGTATFADKNVGTRQDRHRHWPESWPVPMPATTRSTRRPPRPLISQRWRLTGSITAANKTYDGNTAATITSRTLDRRD